MWVIAARPEWSSFLYFFWQFCDQKNIKKAGMEGGLAAQIKKLIIKIPVKQIGT